MENKWTWKLLVLISALLPLAGRSVAQPTYLPFDVQCDANANPNDCPAGLSPGTTAISTALFGINPGGAIAGGYTDPAGKAHGFLLTGFLQSGGTRGLLTNVDVLPSLVGLSGSSTLPTTANGINPSGDIVGNFTVPYIEGETDVVPTTSPAYCPAVGSPACIKGFLYQHGKYSIVLFPGHPGAIPQRIAPDGDIYGCLHDYDLSNSMFGAAWSRLGDTSLLADGGQRSDGIAMPNSMTNGATPGGGVLVGLFADMEKAGNPRRGFVIRSGVFAPFDAVAGSTLTAIWDINPGQQFVGAYMASGVRHGFLKNPDSEATITIDPPGSASTIAYGINPDGVIVGLYTAAAKTHGFVALPPF